MKISGAANVNASQEAIWAALADPEVLSLAIPGLDQIDFADDGSYRFTFTTTIAAVSGTYTGEAGVVERAEPGVRVLRVSAASVKGKVGADVTIRLAAAADDATELSYTADANVDGAIAGIGQRMLASIAKRIAADAIGGLDAAFARPAPAAATPFPLFRLLSRLRPLGQRQRPRMQARQGTGRAVRPQTLPRARSRSSGRGAGSGCAASVYPP